MVAGRWHPWAKTRRDLVVEEEVTPRRGSVGADVGIAEIAIQEVEQRLHRLHLRRVVAGPDRRQAVACLGRRLVTEAGEANRRTAAGSGREAPRPRAGPLMLHVVDVARVGI